MHTNASYSNESEESLLFFLSLFCFAIDRFCPSACCLFKKGTNWNGFHQNSPSGSLSTLTEPRDTTVAFERDKTESISVLKFPFFFKGAYFIIVWKDLEPCSHSEPPPTDISLSGETGLLIRVYLLVIPDGRHGTISIAKEM